MIQQLNVRYVKSLISHEQIPEFYRMSWYVTEIIKPIYIENYAVMKCTEYQSHSFILVR